MEGGARKTIEDIARTAHAGYRTMEDMVVAALREAILSGVYTPGEKLPQEHLAATLGVSRIPVRAALRQLDAEGLVSYAPHRGASVRRLTPDDIAEIYSLRILLEGAAVRSAIDHATDSEIDQLEAIAAELERRDGGAEWLGLRQEFDARLIAIARRPVTGEMIAKLRADVGRYWLSLRVVDRQPDADHRTLVRAIRDRDVDAAQTWLDRHLSRVSSELQRRVRTLGDGEKD